MLSSLFLFLSVSENNELVFYVSLWKSRKSPGGWPMSLLMWCWAHWGLDAFHCGFQSRHSGILTWSSLLFGQLPGLCRGTLLHSRADQCSSLHLNLHPELSLSHGIRRGFPSARREVLMPLLKPFSSFLLLVWFWQQWAVECVSVLGTEEETSLYREDGFSFVPKLEAILLSIDFLRPWGVKD